MKVTTVMMVSIVVILASFEIKNGWEEKGFVLVYTPTNSSPTSGLLVWCVDMYQPGSEAGKESGRMHLRERERERE